MKTRKRFVSNSSSTSFVCDVCGEQDGGMQACLFDVDMYECVNEHIFCSRHSLRDIKDLTLEEKRQVCINDAWREERKEELRNASDEAIEKVFGYSCKELHYNVPEDACPCCQLSSISEDDTVYYLFKKYNTNVEEIKNEIKAKYNHIDDMYKDLETKD